MWNPIAYRRNIARILGMVESLVCNLFDANRPKHDRCRQWGSLNGQDTSNSETLDFKHGKVAITNKAVNEVSIIDNLRMENQLIELTLLVSQHRQIPQVKVCGICTSVEQLIDMCPTLQETESDNAELVGAIGGNQYGRQPSSLGQGKYVVLRFGPTPNMPALNHNYYQ
ncbi:hypothetical protein CR513_02674, partial [Mucuna pruriens]